MGDLAVGVAQAVALVPGVSRNGATLTAARALGASRADAERLRGELREKARAEAEGIIKNAERQIQLETARALEQIRHEAADLSVAIASKLIRKNITREDNERLIDDALTLVGAEASGSPIHVS